MLARVEEIKQQLMDEGVVELALQSLELHRDYAEVVEANLSFHVEMTRTTLCQSLYRSTDCYSLTVSLLTQHNEELAVCRQGLLLLNLAAGDAHCAAFESDDDLRVVLNTLRFFADEEALQAIGAQLLNVLASHRACARA